MNTTVETERRRVLSAAAFATVLGLSASVTLILPAEYGIDPTGVGRLLGLTELAARDVSASRSVQPLGAGSGVVRVSETLTLEPGEGREFKVFMEEGAEGAYRWVATGPVHFDHHGEPEGDTSGYFESYAVGDAAAVEGKFKAFFKGTHGWYWRNDTASRVTVEVLLGGQLRALNIDSKEGADP